MAIVGRNDATGASQTPDTNADLQIISLLSGIYTAEANQEVFRFGFRAGSAASTGPVSFALYDLSTAVSNTDPDGATLVAQGVISSITADVDNTIDITPVALVEGRDYAVAFKIDSGASTVWWTRESLGTGPSSYESDLNGTAAWPSSFSYPIVNTIGNQQYVVWAETQTAAGGPTPIITGVTNPLNTGENVTLTGTGFEATQGTGDVTQEGISLVESAWGDLSVTAASVDIESSVLPYGNNDFQLTNNSANASNLFTRTVGPGANQSTTDMVAPIATSGMRVTAVPAIADQDQLRYDTRLFESDGVTPTAYVVSIAADSTISISGGPVPDGTYRIKVNRWDFSNPSWDGEVLQTVIFSQGSDSTPDPFTFNTVANQPLSQPDVESNEITVSGIDIPAPISIDTGEFNINNGGWTNVATTVNNGDAVKVRNDAAATYSTTVITSLDIGGVIGTFNIVTISDPAGQTKGVRDVEGQTIEGKNIEGVLVSGYSM